MNQENNDLYRERIQIGTDLEILCYSTGAVAKWKGHVVRNLFSVEVFASAKSGRVHRKVIADLDSLPTDMLASLAGAGWELVHRADNAISVDGTSIEPIVAAQTRRLKEILNLYRMYDDDTKV